MRRLRSPDSAAGVCEGVVNSQRCLVRTNTAVADLHRDWANNFNMATHCSHRVYLIDRRKIGIVDERQAPTYGFQTWQRKVLERRIALQFQTSTNRLQ